MCRRGIPLGIWSRSGRPTLRLSTASRAFPCSWTERLSITDYLELPCLDYYQEEPLLVPLPLDYAGKTLTIAQSTDPETESDLTVPPCAVTLAYESELISESFQVAVPSALAFAAGAALLLLSLWRAARGRLDVTLICGAMAMFLYESSQMFSTAFFHVYFEPLSIDIPMLCRKLALLNLLGLLLSKMTGKRRVPPLGGAGGNGSVCADGILFNAPGEKHKLFLRHPFRPSGHCRAADSPHLWFLAVKGPPVFSNLLPIGGGVDGDSQQA